MAETPVPLELEICTLPQASPRHRPQGGWMEGLGKTLPRVTLGESLPGITPEHHQVPSPVALQMPSSAEPAWGDPLAYRRGTRPQHLHVGSNWTSSHARTIHPLHLSWLTLVPPDRCLESPGHSESCIWSSSSYPAPAQSNRGQTPCFFTKLPGPFPSAWGWSNEQL